MLLRNAYRHLWAVRSHDRRSSTHLSMAIAAALAGSTLFSGAASAQQLEEIIVTATRRESDLQSTPLSIQAFSAEQLELAGLERGQDLGIMVPNLVANPPQLFRLRHRQRLKHHLMHESEDRRCGSNTQSQRNHNRCRKPWCLPQLPQRVAKISQHSFLPRQKSGNPRLYKSTMLTVLTRAVLFKIGELQSGLMFHACPNPGSRVQNRTPVLRRGSL